MLCGDIGACQRERMQHMHTANSGTRWRNHDAINHAIVSAAATSIVGVRLMIAAIGV